MKGIILAGGSGTRLIPPPSQYQQAAAPRLRQADDLLSAEHPDAGGHSRHPGDLHAAGHCRAFAELLGDGERWGIAYRYAVQPRPDGLAQAFLIGEVHRRRPAALVLGDNIFYGHDLSKLLQQSAALERAPRCSPTPSGSLRLRRRRVRSRRAALSARRKARKPEFALCRHWTLLLRFAR